MQNFEKIGAFYLGRSVDPATGKTTQAPLLYDARDLTTHAVCVGMTGSGKTGLCISLLEEAALDGIPAIAIDPKGDLGNLLLTFPELRPQDFEPWVDEGEARRKGMSTAQFAADRAELWRKGLADWDQDGDRIRRLRDAAEFSIYTPGSTAGLPLSVLRSLNAPPAELAQDFEAMQERIAASVSGLLALMGIDADPIRSREHILLSNILDRAWRAGRNLDIAALIQQIQQPPFEKIGIMDLEAIYPAKERFGLAMALNNLLASPGFSTWMEGEPLDIQRLLYTPEGKPRLTILSIAHLSEPERMFFVTLLLNEVVAWMRTQPGTSSLRALLYMDEVFGFFPPVANPPSKTPMLTLLKQARAYGLGVVLATQNPVDLDYKGLSNAGTWFLGRLQTERDKARVLDGLEGASTAAGAVFDRKRIETILSGLDSRVFLMNNVHEDEPVLFHTRWAMSYLRGPLTRKQIQQLTADRPAAPAPAAAAATPAAPAYSAPVPAFTVAATATPPPPPPVPEPPVKPPAPEGVAEVFLPVARDLGGEQLVYRPGMLAIGKTHFARVSAKVDHWQDLALFTPLEGDLLGDPWDASTECSSPQPDFERQGRQGAQFAEMPKKAASSKSWTKWTRGFVNHVYQSRNLEIWKCAEHKQYSRPGESEGDFRGRLRHLTHEKRDGQIEKLRKRYGPKLQRLKERIRKQEARVEKEAGQAKNAGVSAAVSLGTTLLGALFGGRTTAGTITGAGTTLRAGSRAAEQKSDIERAKATLASHLEELEQLQAEFEEEVARVEDVADVDNLDLETLSIRPRKSDTGAKALVLAWAPYKVGSGGIAEPAFVL